MRSIKNVRLEGKKVLLRSDFDLPMKDKVIEDDTRLEISSKTIKFVEKAEKVILIGHLGRPAFNEDKYSLQIIKKPLQKLINEEISFSSSYEKIPEGKIILIENLRFFPGEEENYLDFAKKLAFLADLYVNDCFAASHRNHASIVGITKFLPSYAGLNLEKEVEILDPALRNPQRPLVALIGGAKIETKLPIIENLAKICDSVLIGGRLPLEILSGNSIRLLKNVFTADLKERKDIDDKSIDIFVSLIKGAKTIVWNGPMGVFEEEKFSIGTKKIAKAVAESKAFSIVGGGETIAALDFFGYTSKIKHLSMGGGAMLDFLAGKELPGLKALNYYG